MTGINNLNTNPEKSLLDSRGMGGKNTTQAKTPATSATAQMDNAIKKFEESRVVPEPVVDAIAAKQASINAFVSTLNSKRRV